MVGPWAEFTIISIETSVDMNRIAKVPTSASFPLYKHLFMVERRNKSKTLEKYDEEITRISDFYKSLEIDLQHLDKARNATRLQIDVLRW